MDDEAYTFKYGQVEAELTSGADLLQPRVQCVQIPNPSSVSWSFTICTEQCWRACAIELSLH